MRITTKDVVASVLVAAVAVPYIGYLIAGEMPFIHDGRGMAATGLLLGVTAALVANGAVWAPEPRHHTAITSGVVAYALGIAALWAETNEILLALFIAAIVVTWALAERAAHTERRVPVQHA